MFETLFTYPRVLRRHREGPLAEERAAYPRDRTTSFSTSCFPGPRFPRPSGLRRRAARSNRRFASAIRT